MKKFATAIVILLSISACTSTVQRIMPSDQMVSVDGRAHVRGEEAPYTGLITFDHNIGGDRDEVNYVNGVREGTSTTWDRMGKKMREENYVNGRLEGISTSWHGNGQKTETNYVNGSGDINRSMQHSKLSL